MHKEIGYYELKCNHCGQVSLETLRRQEAPLLALKYNLGDIGCGECGQCANLVIRFENENGTITMLNLLSECGDVPIPGGKEVMRTPSDRSSLVSMSLMRPVLEAMSQIEDPEDVRVFVEDYVDQLHQYLFLVMRINDVDPESDTGGHYHAMF